MMRLFVLSAGNAKVYGQGSSPDPGNGGVYGPYRDEFSNVFKIVYLGLWIPSSGSFTDFLVRVTDHKPEFLIDAESFFVVGITLYSKSSGGATNTNATQISFGKPPAELWFATPGAANPGAQFLFALFDDCADEVL